MSTDLSDPSNPNLLAFDRDLRHAFTPIRDKLDVGVAVLDEVLSLFRARIQAEVDFARSLEKLCQRDISASEIGTIKCALQALKADISNEYTARSEFVNSLNEEVYQPLLQMRDLYAQMNKKFAVDTKASIKALRNEQSRWLKVKTRYDRVLQDSNTARQALLEARNATSSYVVKLGTRVNTALRIQKQWEERHDEERRVWNLEQMRFNNTMTSILQGMQDNEMSRMTGLHDASRKCAVFITNFTANRNYDIQGLAQVMDQISPVQDMQEFIQMTLQKFPPPSQSHSMSSDEVEDNTTRDESISRIGGFFSKYGPSEDSFSNRRHSLSNSRSVLSAFTMAASYQTEATEEPEETPRRSQNHFQRRPSLPTSDSGVLEQIPSIIDDLP